MKHLRCVGVRATSIQTAELSTLHMVAVDALKVRDSRPHTLLPAGVLMTTNLVVRARAGSCKLSLALRLLALSPAVPCGIEALTL